jgi:hypothetical protein
MAAYVVVVGNPEQGYTLHGPFEAEHDAHDWIDTQEIIEHSVCVMELHSADENYYEDTEDSDLEQDLDSE